MACCKCVRVCVIDGARIRIQVLWTNLNFSGIRTNPKLSHFDELYSIHDCLFVRIARRVYVPSGIDSAPKTQYFSITDELIHNRIKTEKRRTQSFSLNSTDVKKIKTHVFHSRRRRSMDGEPFRCAQHVFVVEIMRERARERGSNHTVSDENRCKSTLAPAKRGVLAANERAAIPFYFEQVLWLPSPIRLELCESIFLVKKKINTIRLIFPSWKS